MASVEAMQQFQTNSGHWSLCSLLLGSQKEKKSPLRMSDKVVQVVKSQPLNIHLLNILGDEIASTYNELYAFQNDVKQEKQKINGNVMVIEKKQSHGTSFLLEVI